MPAYAIGHITIRNPEKWAEYRRALPPTLERWQAEVVMRGKQAQVLSGTYSHTDTVVLKFPTLDDVIGWHDSEDYQAIVPLREAAADVDLVCFEADS